MPNLYALIPAAGSGSRMQSSEPKQYTRLLGKPMLELTIDALRVGMAPAKLLVVVAPDDRRWQQLSVAADVQFLTNGGATRAHSVLAGLQHLAQTAQRDDWVAVHDAARPCVSHQELQTLVSTLVEDAVGGLLALPVADTLKREQQGRSETTVDRAGLWRALTPQLFRIGVLLDALTQAKDLSQITDEASAVEQLGYQPRLVAGASTNIKVTTPQDWPLAAAILQMQGKQS